MADMLLRKTKNATRESTDYAAANTGGKSGQYAAANTGLSLNIRHGIQHTPFPLHCHNPPLQSTPPCN